jgi:hypothetical protein
VAELTYRQAELGEAVDILAVLKEIAAEIPVVFDSLEREEAIYGLIRTCARSGESWVAADESGGIVGFALVEPNDLRRHYAENEALEIRYAGTRSGHRGDGVLAHLLTLVLDRMVPVAMTVSSANRSDIARHLEEAGFRRLTSPGGEQRYRWEPGAKG